MIRHGLLAILFLLASAMMQATEADFVPLGSGPLGAVTAKDGDSAWDATYFRGDAASAAPLLTRLEPAIGTGAATAELAAGYRARWSGTVTPSRSGSFPIALRATGVATVAVDGKIVLRQSTTGRDFTARRLASIEMRQGRPYEFAIEFRNPDGRARIALEWGAPRESANVAATAAAPTAVETEAGPTRGAIVAAPAQLENANYRVESRRDGTLVVTQKRSGASASFAPEFAVVFQPPGRESKIAPKGAKYEDDGPVGNTNYLVPVWEKESDFLVAAHPRTRLRAERITAGSGKIAWQFPAQPGYVLEAEIDVPADGSEPRLTWHCRALRAGQFSIGYVGAPAIAAADAAWIWQPLVWQDRRFPNRSYLTLEFECPIPFTLAGHGGNAVGVGADPREMPYRMPTYEDSRFGVLVRNAAGAAQSQLFAPVLGRPESKWQPGQDHAFALRLFVGAGAWFDAYKHLAQTLYGFRDYRENTACNLNTTIENLTDFVLSDRFCYWYPRYKTWGYQNDGGAGAGRQQSSADALSLALVFDRAEFFERRSRPTLEYFLSRNTVSTNFTRPEFMGGHVNNASDLVATYRLTGGRTTVIREWFAPAADGADTGKRPPPPNRNTVYAARNELTAELTTYRLTGNRAALERAAAAAERYITERIARPTADFRDLGSSFWTEMAPAYDLLYEIYEDTGERRFLEASAAAMRQFTGYEYLVPVIPDGPFVANPGGTYNRQPVPEEIVPAWQVSANGLASECAATAHSHRGVFMASYAAWMARLGRDVGEPFFRDIARSAVVGRYANYPSYAYRNGYTTLHQKADYPLRPFEEIKKFTSAHYNHPLPMTAFLVDYLVSDFYARSDAHIVFPSEYTNTGAYFRNKVYGAHAGRFYADRDVYLWLPRRLVGTESPQLNYVAGRGNGRLYLAFANQSAQPVTSTVQIDVTRAGLGGRHRARVWRDNQPAPLAEAIEGRIAVTVSPKGITALAIEGAQPMTEIQEAMLAPDVGPLPEHSSRTVHAAFGDVTATALRFGRGLTSVHVWLTAGPEKVGRVVVRYTIEGKAAERAAAEFPFEVTLPVPDSAQSFECRVEAMTSAGSISSPPVTLLLRRD